MPTRTSTDDKEEEETEGISQVSYEPTRVMIDVNARSPT